MHSPGSGRELTPTAFPHSEIPGSKVVCTSPRLIAADHVLHRLLAPRHPPCTLCSLTTETRWRRTDRRSNSAARVHENARAQLDSIVLWQFMLNLAEIWSSYEPPLTCQRPFRHPVGSAGTPPAGCQRRATPGGVTRRDPTWWGRRVEMALDAREGGRIRRSAVSDRSKSSHP